MLIPDNKKGFVGELGLPMGIFLSMPEEQYFKVPAFSYSFSKEFAKSPAHGQAYLSKEFEIDPDRQFFKAVHLLSLEAHRSDDVVVVDGTWSQKVKAEVIAPLLAQGKVVVKQKDFDAAKAISNKLLKNKSYQDLVKESHTEVSIFWQQNGVYCKCRIDRLSINSMGIALFDQKGFGDISSDNLIKWQVLDKKYHWQMAFYGMAVYDIFKEFPNQYAWVFCEDKAPFEHKIRSAPQKLIQVARDEILQQLEKYKTCLEFGVWPGYEEEIKELPEDNKGENTQ